MTSPPQSERTPLQHAQAILDDARAHFADIQARLKRMQNGQPVATEDKLGIYHEWNEAAAAYSEALRHYSHQLELTAVDFADRSANRNERRHERTSIA